MATEHDGTTSTKPGIGRPAERCLSGGLTRITVSELLLFLALQRRTGKLTLRCRDGSGLFVLRNGRIIYGASTSVREAFGNLLVCRGLIDEATLGHALERQQWSGENRRLGAVLLDMGQVRLEDVRDVVRYQVGGVVAELERWRDGFFRFDAMDVPEGGEIEVDVQDLTVAEGLTPEHVLQTVGRELDARDRREDGVAIDHDPATGSEPGEPAGPGEKRTLPGIVEELPTLVLHGEITQKILRRASHVLDRGVLFMVRHDAVVGIGHFGLSAQRTSGLRPEMVRLPVQEPSVLSHVIQHKETYHGPLPPGSGNDLLVRLLGGGRPPEVLAIPLIVGGAAALVLYGDNVPQAGPIGPFRPLELSLAEAGLQIEKEMLDGRTKSLERARRNLGA
jgi:hypothetical protein